MKRRIQLKKKPPPKDYTSDGNRLLCRGIEVKKFHSVKAAKIAAERWNAKHEAKPLGGLI